MIREAKKLRQLIWIGGSRIIPKTKPLHSNASSLQPHLQHQSSSQNIKPCTLCDSPGKA
uniref:Uncharacterized protein n=1 Tax=Triticum urartu TaxID=4572 RepID=A0A8R7R0P8_TRIUA